MSPETPDVLGYYERWVNGNGLRTASALWPRGRDILAPASAPQRRVSAEHATTVEFTQGPPLVDLPHLDAQALAPVGSIVVHGSQATGDACAFSDVDVLAIVEDVRPFSPAEHRRAARALQSLLRRLYRIDPLMHHGLMLLPASALDAYDESFLPLETLGLARVLHGPSRLEIRTVPPDVTRLRARVRGVLYVLRRLVDERAYERSDYALKRLISNVLLLPALIAEARGSFVYKRESFALARPLFREDGWSGIARSEELRRSWRAASARTLPETLEGRIHPCLLNRAAIRRQARENAARLLKNDLGDRWRGELAATFRSAEALVE
jgi:hypothetical protein